MGSATVLSPGNNQVKVDTVLAAHGAAPGLSTIAQAEQAGLINKTTITLTDLLISIAVVTTAAGVGGTQVYTFPQGRILHFGTMAALALSVETEDDFTNGTPEGDMGVGTLAPANDDALGTDSTDDDFATATAFVMASHIDPSIQCPSEAVQQKDGTSTAIPMFVNALVDAADIDDGVTTNVKVNGTITFYWLNLGDF